MDDRSLRGNAHRVPVKCVARSRKLVASERLIKFRTSPCTTPVLPISGPQQSHVGKWFPTTSFGFDRRLVFQMRCIGAGEFAQ